MTENKQPEVKKKTRKLLNPYSITDGSLRSVYATQRELLEVAAVAARQLQSEAIYERYIPTIPGSRPTAVQQTIIDDFFNRQFRHAYILGGNQSGKTQLMCYLAAHCLLEVLPAFKRRSEWGKEPLLILFLSQNSKQIEDSIVRKMRPFFIDADIREIRIGGALQRIVNKKNNNSIVFFTYHNINECRAAVQSFTAHYVFLDELPTSASLIEEAQTRLVKNEGQFVAAFTPKIPVPEVKRLIEFAPPEFTKWYKMSFLDNPSVSQESKEAQLKNAMVHGASKARTILYGDWAPDSNSVFFIDDTLIYKNAPPRYSSYAYVGLDPANTSGFGVVVILYDSHNKIYVVDYACVLRGEVIKCNTDAVQWLKQYILSKYEKIAKIVVDPAAAGFKHELRKLTGFASVSPAKTHEYFWKSIEHIQNMLHRTLFLGHSDTQELYDELMSYTRSENNPEVVSNRRRFHLIDALRYVATYLPPVSQASHVDQPIDPQIAVINLLREEQTEKKKSVLQKIKMNNSLLKLS